MGQAGNRPGQLHAGRAAADDDKGQPALPPALIFLPLRRLKGQQDPAADLQRILHALQGRRKLAPFLPAEIMVPRPGGYNQTIIAQLAIIQDHPPLVGQHVKHFRRQHAHILVLAHRRPQRIGDVAGRQAAGGYLIEQGLEEVKVTPVHQGHPHPFLPAQPPHRAQPAKAAPYHHHMKFVIHLN